MEFTSVAFFVFLALVFAIYWKIARCPLVAQNILIVLASYIFYGWWDWRFLFLINITAMWAWASGLVLDKSNNPTVRQLVVVTAVIVNFGILAMFKYYNFFCENLATILQALGFNVGFESLSIVLPVGISFYTFQALGYVIDVFRREIKPTTNIFAFLAFIIFFPQLVAGPIERASNLLPQFLRPRRFDYSFAVDGCRQMLWGFFKKMVVADNCAVVANTLLDSGCTPNGIGIVVGVVMFAFQIYGDFSGYSDIAIGCAALFGIRLKQNFSIPYFARNIEDFWRRWHISLMTWFRDYLYIPLGGSRCSVLKCTRNIFIVFSVSGLWHGASWTFVCWGLFHALLFTCSRFIMKKDTNGMSAQGNTPVYVVRRIGMVALTFSLVTIGWTFFRAQTMHEWFIWSMAVIDLSSWTLPVNIPHELWTAIGAVAVMQLVEWINRNASFDFAIQPQNMFLRRGAYVLIFLLVVFYAPGGASFIYFQF